MKSNNMHYHGTDMYTLQGHGVKKVSGSHSHNIGGIEKW